MYVYVDLLKMCYASVCDWRFEINSKCIYYNIIHQKALRNHIVNEKSELIIYSTNDLTCFALFVMFVS